MKNVKKRSNYRMLLDDKRGQLMDLPVKLMMAFISVTFLIALLPGFQSVIVSAQASNSLNCPGYTSPTNPALSYNATLAGYGYTSTIGCLAITLYVPYIVLGVLVGLVAIIFYGKAMGGQQQQQPQYGYGY